MVDRGTGLVLTLGGGYPRDLTVGSESFSDVVNAHADVYSGAKACMCLSFLHLRVANDHSTRQARDKREWH